MAKYLIFPLTMLSALCVTWVGIDRYEMNPALVGALVVLVFGFGLIPFFERMYPYRKEWLKNDKDVGNDIINLVVNFVVTTVEKPLLVGLLLSASLYLSQYFEGGLWPNDWGLAGQLALMLVIAEFGRYWIHYAAHKVPLLWRFHAVHHSPNRLYFLNAARFHPIEKMWFQLPEVVPFILLGTNIEAITLYLVFNNLHGLFQHSNIRLRLGWLNYIFSMTELHRWHHSKIPDESDRNFGNNLIIWDIVFGSFYYPKNISSDPCEVATVGLLNDEYPKTYLAQLKAPFHKKELSKPQNLGESN